MRRCVGSSSPTSLGLLEAQAAEFEARHARFLAGAFGDPALPSVARTHGWLADGAVRVRRAVAALRREALPPEERIEVRDDGGSVVVDLGAPCRELEDAVHALPGRLGVWRTEPRAWRVPPRALDAFAAAMGRLSAPEAAVVAARLSELRGAPAP